jgi:hypothetical protein
MLETKLQWGIAVLVNQKEKAQHCKLLASVKRVAVRILNNQLAERVQNLK